MNKTSRFLLITGITAILAGCKLAVIVVEGGEVESLYSGTCVAGDVCIHEVNDAEFGEWFFASPAEGWYFEKWNSGDRFLCSNSTSPECALEIADANENEAIETLIASSETFYLMPIFKPYKDIVTVNGKQWLQVDLFKNLTWDEINEVCPDGACVDNGLLNGQDMTGWTWASVEDVHSLFNYYLGGEVLGPGPDDGISSNDNPPPPNLNFAYDFFSDGWRATRDYLTFQPVREWEGFEDAENLWGSRRIAGAASGPIKGNCTSGSNPSGVCAYSPRLKQTGLDPWGSSYFSYAGTSPYVSHNAEGAWFYRTL